MEAVRTCTGTEDKLDTSKDISLIKKCIKKGHTSVLEHIVLSFKIEDVSRDLLQEIVRHRTGSFSVLSTRWALKKSLKGLMDDIKEARTCLYQTGDSKVDLLTFTQLNDIIRVYKEGYGKYENDKMKYALPGAFLTNIFFTIDLRNFRHLLFLRTAPDVLEEFRELATTLFEILPAEIQELCEDMRYGHPDYPGEEVKRLKEYIKELEEEIRILKEERVE